MDVQFDLEYAMALTAYVQALVAELIDGHRGRATRPTPFHRLLVAENKWLAARYGLDAPLIDLGDRPQVDDDRGAAREAAPAPARAVREGSRVPRRAARHRADALVGHRRRPVRCASTTRTATSSRSCGRYATSARRVRPGLTCASRSASTCSSRVSVLLAVETTSHSFASRRPFRNASPGRGFPRPLGRRTPSAGDSPSRGA